MAAMFDKYGQPLYRTALLPPTHATQLVGPRCAARFQPSGRDALCLSVGGAAARL
jgi:hypothetical protein